MALNPKDPRTQKGILMAVGVGALLYVHFFTTVLPFTWKAGAAQASALELEYRDASKELNKARQAAHSLPYLEREYQLLHRKWQLSQALLPEDQDTANLLRTVTLLGTRAGVEFTLFRPMPPKPEQYHTANPVEVKVVGGYHQIGAFLADLANMNRVLNVSELQIVANKDKVEDQPAEASFVASTYTLGGSGVPPEVQAKDNNADGKGKPDGKSGVSGRSARPETGAKTKGRPDPAGKKPGKGGHE